MTKIVFFLTLILSFGNSIEKNKEYHREYYTTGETKAKGWIHDGQKIGYWFFYHSNGKVSEKGIYSKGKRNDYWYFFSENGKLKEQGDYKNGEKTDWWLFYDENGSINHKCQLNNGLKNGYCLGYKNDDIIKAEKYENGKRLKAWTSFRSFKKENKLSDLR